MLAGKECNKLFIARLKAISIRKSGSMQYFEFKIVLLKEKKFGGDKYSAEIIFGTK